mmetsp:Transcript_39893/g.79835  ORF Transcript_39893/g.79835 Transcript_39893/m.79835 type:complete len:144 (-) Transcript_39893:224-655(-)
MANPPLQSFHQHCNENQANVHKDKRYANISNFRLKPAARSWCHQLTTKVAQASPPLVAALCSSESNGLCDQQENSPLGDSAASASCPLRLEVYVLAAVVIARVMPQLRPLRQAETFAVVGLLIGYCPVAESCPHAGGSHQSLP